MCPNGPQIIFSTVKLHGLHGHIDIGQVKQNLILESGVSLLVFQHSVHKPFERRVYVLQRLIHTNQFSVNIEAAENDRESANKASVILRRTSIFIAMTIISVIKS